MAQKNPHGNLKIDCAECHTSKSWQITGKQSFFDHTKTGFPLLGAHRIADCRSCHTDLIFSYTGTACADCHTDIHKSELGINCDNCHTPQNWENRQEILENHNLTRFPLIATHAVVDCEACHFNQQRNEYANTPIDCKYCHYQNFIATTNPDHQTAGFNLDCLSCHNITAFSWKQAKYQHSLLFPLTGAHRLLPCESCHINGQYSVLPTDCWSCHDSDYIGITDPDHTQNNFDHDCTVCHSTQAWTPTTFDHSTTNFPLTGAHQSLNCVECHAQGYAGTPTDCFSCHDSDYNSTTNPNHLAAGFPTSCEDCHNTSNWNQITWDHDSQYFPIYSGKHKNEWTTCDECHVDPNNYSVFECIYCHKHSNQAQVDADHSEVTGYVYASWACYDCHPNGDEKSKLRIKMQKSH